MTVLPFQGRPHLYLLRRVERFPSKVALGTRGYTCSYQEFVRHPEQPREMMAIIESSARVPGSTQLEDRMRVALTLLPDQGPAIWLHKEMTLREAIRTYTRAAREGVLGEEYVSDLLRKTVKSCPDAFSFPMRTTVAFGIYPVQERILLVGLRDRFEFSVERHRDI